MLARFGVIAFERFDTRGESMDTIPASCRGSGGNVHMGFSARDFLHWECRFVARNLRVAADSLADSFLSGSFLTGSYFVGGSRSVSWPFRQIGHFGKLGGVHGCTNPEGLF